MIIVLLRYYDFPLKVFVFSSIEAAEKFIEDQGKSEYDSFSIISHVDMR